MRKIGILAILILAGLGIFANGAMAITVPTPTVVAGIVYESDNITPVPGASVEIECDGATGSATSIGDGSYTVNFTGTSCDVGDTAYVTATKDEQSGTASGLVNDWIVVRVAVVNVSIPEFGAIAGITTILASGISFLVIRKRTLAKVKSESRV